MINWNDIRVEQQIAQERYQAIIQTRRQQAPTKEVKWVLYPKLRHWLGQRLIVWGHKLQRSESQFDSFDSPVVEWSH